MTFYSYDWLFAGGVLAILALIYTVRQWLKAERRVRAIQEEIDGLPPLDFSQGYTAPRDPMLSLNALNGGL